LSAAQQGTSDNFSRPIVIRHIKRIKSGINIALKVIGTHFRVKQPLLPFDIGNLPQPCQGAADV
jgi:hypothetical protein